VRCRISWRSPIGDGIGSEKEREHGADAINGDAGRSPCGQLRGAGFEHIVDFRMRREMAQHRESRCHRKRIAGESTGLIDGAEGRNLPHDVGAAAVGSDGKASADDLTQSGEIGADAVALLRAAESDAESGP